MSDELRVACAQPNSVIGDLSGTVASHAAMIRAAESDVVVFPEMSVTGYDLRAGRIDAADPRLGAIVAACTDTDTLALVGAPVCGAEGLDHIAVLAIDAGGASVVYHKMHIGRDEHGFAPGQAPAVVEVRGWRLGLAVCRDTGIEEHAAATVALGIDVYAAGVVDRPDDAEVQLERGRRIAETHGVWVAVASSAAPAIEPFRTTAGRSFVLAPGGAILDRVGPTVGETARSTLRR